MKREATRVLGIAASDPAPEALAEAASTLGAGALVAFPTETFYGLGAAGLNARAVRRVFEVKGRAESKPLLLLVDSVEMALAVAAEVPPAAHELMARHWPGPLTLVLRSRPMVPDEVTAGTGTVGLRLSAHPVARALVRALGAPITAPSANPSGAQPPTTAAAVLRHFDGRIALVLDAGPTPGGLASTVLDLTVEPARVLRQGAVHVGA
jgi:L-threonylcarbamoyladenylate synthase